MPRASGIGGEFYGDPFGGGGPIHVVRARAIKGQVVRVAFDAPPLAVSAAGVNDGLNPVNYTVTVVTGQASQPLSVGVDPDPIPGPAAVVLAGETGLDVHVDRPLVVGIRYRITVSTQVRGATGGAMGAPYAAEFTGVVLLRALRVTPRRTDLVDIRNDPFVGRFLPTSAGDLQNQGGIDSLRKRILRRLVTPTNAFAHLPGYGLGLRLKDPASIAQLQAFKAEALTQIGQEPEVVAASITVTQEGQAAEVIRVHVSVRTRTGLSVEVGAAFDSSGGVIL